VLLAFTVVVGVVISIAALIDPFDRMPSLDEVWADCQGTDAKCDLAHRFPGFWGYVAVNLAYAVIGAVLLVWLVLAVRELRRARPARFGGAADLDRYVRARGVLILVALGVAIVAVLPIVAAALR